NLREQVRFSDTVHALLDAGHRLFVEASPHPVLALGLEQVFEAADAVATVVPTLRRDQGGSERVVRALGEAFAAGAAVDWRACFPAGGARVVDLPTYPFQRRRHWEESVTRPVLDPAGLGLTPAGHPLIGAALEVADADTRVLTGRLSATGTATGTAWLADHRVDGTVLVPGAALVEWALRAADEAGGHGGVEELTLHAPLVLPPSGNVRIQIVVNAADDDGHRTIRVHSRPDHGTDASAADADWLCHATGTLTVTTSAPGGTLTGAWPPPGAQPVSLDGFYERAAESGYGYGPAFQGLRAVWRDGDDLLAEVALPEAAGDPDGFGVHPALLDAVLHPALLLDVGTGGTDAVWLPFGWNDVSLRATGATSVRVRITPRAEAAAGEGRAFGVEVADAAGAPVLDVASVVLRPADAQGLRAAARAGARGLFTLEWTPLPTPSETTDANEGGPWHVLGPWPAAPGAVHHADLTALAAALDAGAPVPVGVLTASPAAGAAADDGLTAAQDALRLVQGWLAEPRLAGSRLVFVTRGAVAAAGRGATEPDADRSVNAAANAVWGLVRATQAEHPDQFVLLDLDPASEDDRVSGGLDPIAAAALAVAADEPQAAVRAARVLVPRLARVTSVPPADPTAPGSPGALDPDGTVLITGGTGTLGSQVAEHLVRTWDVRHLVLVGRRGPDAPGAADLADRLTALGARVRLVAADVAEPEAVARVVAGIDPQHPLTAVIHAAGALDDAVVTAQSDARLARAWHAKATAARHLHEATARLPLALFVTFSSAAGVIGNVGQAGYAAANAYVDALVAGRRAAGLPGVSIAWGLWERTSGLTGHLTEADLARLRRSGLSPLPTGLALELLDAACRPEHSLVVAAGIDVRGVPAADLPAVLRGLSVRGSRPTAAAASAADPAQATELAKQLAGLDEAGRLAAVTDLVRSCVAVVLGHDSPAEVRTDAPFKDLGFESVTAVELRNRLAARCGLRLPATLAFDHPTPDALAAHLCGRLAGRTAVTAAPPPAAVDEPVAIVAMACRYPGGVRSPEDLWDLVTGAVDAMGAFPEGRGWDLERLFHPDPDHPGTSYSDRGAFLYDADGFDADFFGISPREALAMDPQQRLLLETSWELLERAGISPAALKGSRTGMFAGVMYHDYATGLATSGDAKLEGYAMLASSGSAATGRVSYTLGLEGPAMTVDTACSSSLVAMHLAAQALRQGECSLALAGGVTVMATPEVFTGFSRQRGLAPDGRCKPFAAAADGTGWGEGVGLVLLERLSDARRNGHRILAVLRGSAVNQDGASNGLTAPNGPSQERVIRQALAQAGLEPADVDAVEAHGTGTTLGDPIEAGALLATYGRERPAGRPLFLGSVKSNIGHTQAAAGVAGVIKTVMAMRHGVLPASLHIDAPTPHVDWESGAVALLTERTAWPATDRARRAGVSSFGASGTNAHLILEQGPDSQGFDPEDLDPDALGPDAAQQSDAERAAAPVPWVVSGRTPEALRAQATALTAHLSTRPAAAERIGRTLATARTAFEHRAVVLGSGRDELLAGLAALAAAEPHPAVVCPGEPAATTGPGPVLVFPGQGSQWAGMGAELLNTSTVFADRIADCAKALEPHVDWSLTEVLRGNGAELARVDVVQPVLWAVMVSLAAVWADHDVTPAAVIGHSQGEMAAACVAGALTLEDGARVVALRSKALRRLAGRGAMASLQTDPEAAHALCAAHPGVTVAAVNGPGSVVVSGPPEPVAAAVADAESQGLRARLIDVDYASHGPQIDEITDELATVLAGVRPRTAPVAFYSTVTGERIDTTALDTGYWITNLRQQVRFADAVDALLAAGHRVFVEASPHPVTTLGVQECIERAGVAATVVSTLRRDAGGPNQVGHALAHAFTAGAPVDWTGWLPAAGPVLDLPTYPFQHRPYWLAARSGGPVDADGLGLEAAHHPVLAAATRLADSGTHLLTGRLTQRGQPWLPDHRVLGTTLVPGAALVEWALRAADEAGRGRVEELTLQAPLVLPETGGARIQVAVGAPGADGRCEVSIHARADADGDHATPAGQWTCHATGTLAPASDTVPAPEPGTVWPPTGARALDVTGFYERAAESGYGYGPAFQGLRAVWRDGDDLLAEVALPEAAGDPDGFGVHPALLDAALQTALLLDADSDAGNSDAGADGVWLPFAWNGVCLWATGATTVRVRITPHAPGPDANGAHGDSGRGIRVAVADAVGAPVLTADSVVLRAADPARLRAAPDDGGDGLFAVEWTPLPAPDVPPRTAADNPWTVIGATAGTADATTGQVHHRDLAALVAALDDETPAPPVVLAPVATGTPAGDEPDDALDATTRALALIQHWLAEPRLTDSRLVLVTRGAVTADDADREPDPAGAAVWGLARSAQSEEPDRLALLDLGPGHEPTDPAVLTSVAGLVAAGEPQAALREGRLLAPRLVRATSPGAPTAALPARSGAWRLESGPKATLEDVLPVPAPEAEAPLEPGQVRISVRAAGVNFRDALVSLGMAPGQTGLGSEGAGVVVETGPDVTGFAPGDRVMGLFAGAFGPLAVADARMLTTMPPGWDWATAAAVPVVFATAWFGLVDLGRVQPGEKVLVHAATGGVGTAAVQIARYVGAEVFATASPG
ncbi:SDR family NAD(P)-dependent oxidoreductase, partial [Streptomyces sp. NPDC047315]|uniref:SDR family NAD(P)-dependent oxidoreductase n=1 Tax=Streptomyces sp. NPDC047315 TaxID=3155142 RepID=UPI0033FF7E69